MQGREICYFGHWNMHAHGEINQLSQLKKKKSVVGTNCKQPFLSFSFIVCTILMFNIGNYARTFYNKDWHNGGTHIYIK